MRSSAAHPDRPARTDRTDCPARSDLAASVDDEFRFLAGDARRVGRSGPLPDVARTTLGPTGSLSALAFEPAAPPELIALHGAGLNAHSFDPMLLALGRPALSLDLPGHGRSAWREDADYRAGTIAPAIADALAPLAELPRDLLGHSLGGLVSALVASRLPGLVRRLFVVDITPGVLARTAAAAKRGTAPGSGSASGSAPESAAARTSAVQEFITGQRDYGSVEEIVERAIAFGIGSDRASLTRGVTLNTRRREDGRLEWTHHLAHLDGLQGSGGAAGAPGDDDPAEAIWAALAGVDAPVTLIRATDGVVDEALAAEWRERVPGSEILVIAGPHNLHEAAPAELAAAIR